jgi:hypothetical protein
LHPDHGINSFTTTRPCALEAVRARSRTNSKRVSLLTSELTVFKGKN